MVNRASNRDGRRFDIRAIVPKRSASPQRTLEQRAEQDVANEKPRDRSPPPPGMGKLVDRLA